MSGTLVTMDQKESLKGSLRDLANSMMSGLLVIRQALHLLSLKISVMQKMPLSHWMGLEFVVKGFVWKWLETATLEAEEVVVAEEVLVRGVRITMMDMEVVDVALKKEAQIVMRTGQDHLIGHPHAEEVDLLRVETGGEEEGEGAGLAALEEDSNFLQDCKVQMTRASLHRSQLHKRFLSSFNFFLAMSIH